MKKISRVMKSIVISMLVISMSTMPVLAEENINVESEEGDEVLLDSSDSTINFVNENEIELTDFEVYNDIQISELSADNAIIYLESRGGVYCVS